MSDNTIQFSVFTKPWKTPIPELAKFVADLGFQAIELPVRPGYPVNPNNMAKELPNAARILGEHGVKIASIAGPTDEAAMAACQSAEVPIIRICVNIDSKIGYMASEESLQREYDALVPLLEKHRVTLGIQNHCGACICNAMGLRHLLEKYHPKHIAAVWDCSHNALNGEEPEMALDIVWDRICMVNFKNAYWRRKSGPRSTDGTVGGVLDIRKARACGLGAGGGGAKTPTLSRNHLLDCRVQRRTRRKPPYCGRPCLRKIAVRVTVPPD